MAQFIGFCVAMLVVYVIPYMMDKKNDQIKRNSLEDELRRRTMHDDWM